MNNYEFVNDEVLAKFINYMKSALRNRKINYLKEQQKYKNAETTTLDEIADMFTDDISDSYNCLKIKILNDKEKVLLHLHYTQGLSYEEISRITDEKVETLKKRRNRAIYKLRKEMDSGYEE